MDKIKPITLGIIALLLCLLVFNFFLQRDSKQTQETKENIKTSQNTKSLDSNIDLLQRDIDNLQKSIYELQKQEMKRQEALILEQKQREVQKNTQEILEDKIQNQPQEKQEKIQETQQKEEVSKNVTQILQKEPETKKDSICKKERPQLAIIIDDVSTIEQIKAINALPFDVTPSIFPYSKATPDGKKIAQNAKFYMVHLPLEALNFYQKDHGYLLVSDNKETIAKKIAMIKKDFPNLTYLNNHTGSKFTQDKQAMTFLLDELHKNHITFLDSKTIGNIYSPKYFATHKQVPQNACQKSPFLIRDVFLDNTRDVAKITEQLLLSIKIAKKQGYAIAIGHPYKETFLALINAKEYLQSSGVDLVFLDKLVIP